MNCTLQEQYDKSERISNRDIERSIIKTYRKEIWKPFIDAINEFNLIEDGDKIGICISGGKDSFLTAKLFQEIQRHGKKKFELFFMSMDPGFNEINRNTLIENAEYLNIPLNIKNSDVFSVAEKIAGDNPCYMCARMRRGFLYNYAKENGCNKIALGHHFDDVIETTMLNILYAGNFKTMMPRIMADNFEDMELTRPMFYIHESAIKKWAKNTKLNFMNCGCMVVASKTSTKRDEIKQTIKYLSMFNPNAPKSIMRSAFNVHLDAVLGYKKDGIYHNFLEKFEREIDNVMDNKID
ncbi:MAG: tRNA 2-thiocytidine biosynthesis TtcA family protein [Lachnospirales bacterium]